MGLSISATTGEVTRDGNAPAPSSCQWGMDFDYWIQELVNAVERKDKRMMAHCTEELRSAAKGE